jgi:hypothetical protein
VSRRAYTRIPRQTRWTLCRSAQRRWSLEVEPAAGKLKEAATRPIAGPRQAQRRATAPRRTQKRRTHLTQRRRQHEPLRRRRPQLPAEIRRSTPRLLAETLAAKHSLSKHHQYTEDPNIPSTRVDAYVETPTEKYPPEAKLCMSSGATLGTAQKSRTLKLGIQQAAPTFPQQHISTAERPLKDYIVQKSTDVPTKAT